jgi:AAA domain
MSNLYDMNQGAFKFNELSLKHHMQDQALKKAEFLIQFCPNIRFVTIAGPTGVGKTHLLSRLATSLEKIYSIENTDAPSAISCISTIAVAAGAKQFDWRRFYIDALEALRDPFAKTRPKTNLEQSRFKAINESASAGELRAQLEAELRMRNTKVWIIDEAQHQLTGGKKGEPGDQFDVLKSISQTTNTKLVLAGTYDLPNFLSYTGQVMRRNSTVHLPRYHYQSSSDVKNFSSVALTLLKHLYLKTNIDVASNFDLLYLGSLGCVGVLKDWLARGRAMAIFKGSDVLTIEHLKETMLSPQTLDGMIREIADGENLQKQEFGNSLKEKILGSFDKKVSENNNLPNRANTQRLGSRRPGVRLPKHDHVPNHMPTKVDGV